MTKSTLSEADQQRVELAVSCRDCDLLPRVDHAGETQGDGNDAIQIMHNGLRTYCGTHYGDYNVEVIRQLRGIHEPQEERVFYEVLKHIPAGGTILELGSFWAYYSMWFLKEVDQGRAVLIEPVPSALEAGKRNFALNGYQGTFVHAAVSDVCRSRAEIELWKGFSVEAETVNVDSVLESQGIDFLDILHADIQGTEARMLRGASKALIEKRIGWVFISTHSEYIHQKCLQELRKHGYSIVAEHTLAESHSVDGLIVASAKHCGLKIPISKRKTSGGLKRKLRAKLRVKVLEFFRLRTENI
jgi:FkbM family methyltransferase